MTRNDLPLCPLCDGVVCSYEGARRRKDPVIWCSEPDCRYSATMSEQHVVLARRAEVGRLVEEMIGSVDTKTPALMLAHNVMSLTFTVATGKPHAEAPSLLEALRALATEVQS